MLCGLGLEERLASIEVKVSAILHYLTGNGHRPGEALAVVQKGVFCEKA